MKIQFLKNQNLKVRIEIIERVSNEKPKRFSEGLNESVQMKNNSKDFR